MSAPPSCSAEQPTLYVSIVAGVLLILSEVLGYWNKRHPDRPCSITGAVVQGAQGVIKALTPPTSPQTSYVEVAEPERSEVPPK